MSLFSNKIYLSDDIINHILSFGDPEITEKYNLCLIQLLYNKKEFEFLRQSKMSIYYNWKEEYFKYFILIRVYQKKKLNYKTCYRPIINMCQTYGSTRFYMKPVY